MEIRQTYHLTDQQMSEVRELVGEGGKDGEKTFSFPFEDGTSFYLLYETVEFKLVSVLALILPECGPPAQNLPEYAECVAFTHPDFRQKGYFTALFHAAEAEFEDLDLLFPVNAACQDAIETLKALGAELDRVEYRMEAELEQILSPDDGTADTGRQRLSFLADCQTEGCQAADCQTEGCQAADCQTEGSQAAGSQAEGSQAADCQTTETENNGEDILFSFYLGRQAVGDCRVIVFQCLSEAERDEARPYEERAVGSCLYGFEIVSGLRGQGLGGEALFLVLNDLKKRGIRRVLLHVSGDNKAAVHLYQKAGFQITESLNYYLF